MIRVPPAWRTPRPLFPDDLCDLQRSVGCSALPPKMGTTAIGRTKQSDHAQRGKSDHAHRSIVADVRRDVLSPDDENWDESDLHENFGTRIPTPPESEHMAVTRKLVTPERSKEERRFGSWPCNLEGTHKWFLHAHREHAGCWKDTQWKANHKESTDALSVDVKPLTTPRNQGLNIFAKGSYNTVEQLSNTVIDQFNIIHRLFHRVAATMRSTQDAEIQQVLRKVTKDLKEAFEVTNNTFNYLLATHKHLESVAENERARVAAMEEQLGVYEESFVKQATVIKELRHAQSTKDLVKIVDDKLALEKKFAEAEKVHREELRRMKDKIIRLENQLQTESVCKQQPISVRSSDSLTQQDSVRRDNTIDFDSMCVSKDSDSVLSAHKTSQIALSAVNSCGRDVKRKPSIRTNDKSVKLKTLDDKLKRCKNALGLSSTSLMLLKQLFGLLQCPECHNPLSVPKVTTSGVTVCAACLPRYSKKPVGDKTKRACNNLLADAMLAEFRKNLPANVSQLVNDIQTLQQE